MPRRGDPKERRARALRAAVHRVRRERDEGLALGRGDVSELSQREVERVDGAFKVNRNLLR